jgi:hypothetical protein
LAFTDDEILIAKRTTQNHESVYRDAWVNLV